MELLRSLATEVYQVRSESEVVAPKFADELAKSGELEVKVQLLVVGAENVGGLQTYLYAKEAELAFAMSALDASEPALKAKNWECGELNLELRSVRAAVGRREKLMNGLSECFCTVYTSLVCAQELSYRDCPKTC